MGIPFSINVEKIKMYARTHSTHLRFFVCGGHTPRACKVKMYGFKTIYRNYLFIITLVYLNSITVIGTDTQSKQNIL